MTSWNALRMTAQNRIAPAADAPRRTRFHVPRQGCTPGLRPSVRNARIVAASIHGLVRRVQDAHASEDELLQQIHELVAEYDGAHDPAGGTDARGDRVRGDSAVEPGQRQRRRASCIRRAHSARGESRDDSADQVRQLRQAAKPCLARQVPPLRDSDARRRSVCAGTL